MKTGRPTVNPERLKRTIDLIGRGVSVTDAARLSGVSRQTLTRYGIQRGKIGNFVGSYKLRPAYRPYGETMMDILYASTSDSLPRDVREEICQQLAVEILSDYKAFALLRDKAKEIYRRTKREYYSNKFKTISLDSPIGENGKFQDMVEG